MTIKHTPLIIPAHVAEMTTPDLIALIVRLGLIFLGAILLMRVAGAVISRVESAIRHRADGEPIAREKRSKTIGGVLRGGTRSLIFIVAAMMAVRELGMDITPIIAAAGGFGVAAGLGAQSLVRDWIVGFFIIHDDQYDVGDVVRIAGVAGTIEQLSLRHTELRDGDGSLHFIPNGEIKIVTNLTKSWAAPLVRIPINSVEDSEQVLHVLGKMAEDFRRDKANEHLLVDGPKVLGIDDVQPGQYTVLIQVRTRPENRYNVTRMLRTASLRALRAADISLAGTPLVTDPNAANAATAAATAAAAPPPENQP